MNRRSTGFTNSGSFASRLARASLLAVMVALLIAAVGPLFWMLTTSFKPESDIHAWPPRWLPSDWTWEHYRELFERIQFARAVVNSIIVTGAVTLLSLFFNALAGYTFAKFRFPFREGLFGLLLLLLIVPTQITLIPVFLVLKSLGLLNTYLGLILPGSVSVFGIFLIRQYMLSIPDSYIESARMDGCSEFRIFWSVVIPLCHPILAALGIFTFTAIWSDFMLPLIVVQEESMYTLPLALANLNGQHLAQWGLLMAGATVTIAPIVAVFLILQRRFIEGLTITGIKG